MKKGMQRVRKAVQAHPLFFAFLLSLYSERRAEGKPAQASISAFACSGRDIGLLAQKQPMR